MPPRGGGGGGAGIGGMVAAARREARERAAAQREQAEQDRIAAERQARENERLAIAKAAEARAARDEERRAKKAEQDARIAAEDRKSREEYYAWRRQMEEASAKRAAASDARAQGRYEHDQQTWEQQQAAQQAAARARFAEQRNEHRSDRTRAEIMADKLAEERIKLYGELVPDWQEVKDRFSSFTYLPERGMYFASSMPYEQAKQKAQEWARKRTTVGTSGETLWDLDQPPAYGESVPVGPNGELGPAPVGPMVGPPPPAAAGPQPAPAPAEAPPEADPLAAEVSQFQAQPPDMQEHLMRGLQALAAQGDPEAIEFLRRLDGGGGGVGAGQQKGAAPKAGGDLPPPDADPYAETRAWIAEQQKKGKNMNALAERQAREAEARRLRSASPVGAMPEPVERPPDIKTEPFKPNKINPVRALAQIAVDHYSKARDRESEGFRNAYIGVPMADAQAFDAADETAVAHSREGWRLYAMTRELRLALERNAPDEEIERLYNELLAKEGRTQ